MSEKRDASEIRVCSSIDSIPGEQWDRLIRDDYPFLKHAFLSAIERHQCVGGRTGWIPRHLAYFQNQSLAAAMPLYEKHNSWGEFVFDHVWADAFSRYGFQYYPKLINAIPFTPARGQRILLDAADPASLSAALLSAARALARGKGCSGIHCLFPDSKDHGLLDQAGAVCRHDCHFHWHNRGYDSFEDFLRSLKPRKRKNICRERRKVKDANIDILWLDGHSAGHDDWKAFTALYRRIYDRKYGMPVFNTAFFEAVAHNLADQIHLVLAKSDGRSVAAALMYSDNRTLYGRHWGCDRYIDSLHFELCYYQGIEYCIERGLERFDPGVQGEHKIARGFEPTQTRSLHWILSNPFAEAISRFARREQKGVRRYIEAVNGRSPFRTL